MHRLCLMYLPVYLSVYTYRLISLFFASSIYLSVYTRIDVCMSFVKVYLWVYQCDLLCLMYRCIHLSIYTKDSLAYLWVGVVVDEEDLGDEAVGQRAGGVLHQRAQRRPKEGQALARGQGQGDGRGARGGRAEGGEAGVGGGGGQGGGGGGGGEEGEAGAAGAGGQPGGARVTVGAHGTLDA
jgi:uncharacterized membrane protein YgcG